jgi:hypothetical protein
VHAAHERMLFLIAMAVSTFVLLYAGIIGARTVGE